MNNNVQNTSFTNTSEGSLTYDLISPYSKHRIKFIYSNIFRNEHHVYEYFQNEFTINESKFYNLCLSSWIFHLFNGEAAQEIIHSKDFDLTKFKHSIKKLYDKYSNNGLIVFPLSTEVHFPY